jgi:hypothetical protein
MWERYGQLDKGIVGRALGELGVMRLEHEVPIPDVQSGDAYFVPEPGHEDERALLGWLDPMTREPCLLELVQRTPGPVDVRNNLRKQLTLDHSVALEAEKRREPRPPLVRLWQITTARPKEVLEGYGMTSDPSWPPGFWMAPRLLSMGVVVLSEVPRRRDTLLLRLLGRGRVLEEAIADLEALPNDAREREVALPSLIALRFEVKQEPTPDDEARAFLMATQDLYEQWEKRVERRGAVKGVAKGKAEGLAKGKAEGLALGMVRSLVATYETRFGRMSQSLRRALTKAASPERTDAWVKLFVTASAEEIAAAIRKGQPPR